MSCRLSYTPRSRDHHRVYRWPFHRGAAAVPAGSRACPSGGAAGEAERRRSAGTAQARSPARIPAAALAPSSAWADQTRFSRGPRAWARSHAGVATPLPAGSLPPPPPLPPRTPAPTKRHSGPEGFCEGSFHVTLRYSRALTHPFAESRRRDVLTYSKTLPRSASESPQDLAAPGVVLSYAPWIATKAVSILRRKERLKCLPRQAFQSALIPPWLVASHIPPPRPVLRFPTSDIRKIIFSGIITLSYPTGILWEWTWKTLRGAQTLQQVLDIGYNGRWRTEHHRCDYLSKQEKWRTCRK